MSSLDRRTATAQRAGQTCSGADMLVRLLAASSSLMMATAAAAAPVLAEPAELSAGVKEFVHVPAGRTAITHLRISSSAPSKVATAAIEAAYCAFLASHCSSHLMV